jgi:putative phage-type endonuclease
MEVAQTGRRITPTGRLILPATAARAAWLEARRSGIGSSDMAAILGLSKYGNELTVFHDKRGNLPLESDDSEPALWGRSLEDNVAREWTRRNRSVTRRVGLVANVDRPWQMCTLDRRVVECPLPERGHEKCALEIKCRSAFKAPMWRKGTPDDVMAQVIHQGDATGYDHLHVAVLVGGNDYRQFTIHMSEHQQLRLDLRAAAEDLWVNHVLANRPPVLNGSEDPGPLLDLYQRLHPDREGAVRLDRDTDAQDALHEYVTAAAAERDAKRAKEVAKAKLIGALGDARVALAGDRLLYSMEPRSKQWTDVRRLAEEYPEAYAECVEDRGHDQLTIPTMTRKEYA